jgi:hypothetical protein
LGYTEKDPIPDFDAQIRAYWVPNYYRGPLRACRSELVRIIYDAPGGVRVLGDKLNFILSIIGCF